MKEVLLNSLKNESKKEQKLLQLINRGLEQAKQRHLNRASLFIRKAFENDPLFTKRFLSQKILDYQKEHDYDSVVFVGKFLLNINKKHFELANLLGNCSRRLGRFSIANHYYKQALRANKNFHTATLNLAASLGRIERYDEAVLQLIKDFANFKEFIIPEALMLPLPKSRKKIIHALASSHKRFINHQMRALLQQKKEAIAREDSQAVREITAKTRDLFHHELSEDVTSEEFQALLQYIVEKESERIHIPEGLHFENLIYNLGLQKYQEKKYGEAEFCFAFLEKHKDSFVHLKMLMALVTWKLGNHKKAITMLTDINREGEESRFTLINLGLMYRLIKNLLLEYKYLAMGGSLLEKTDGLYQVSEIVKLADSRFMIGSLDEALDLYQSIAPELHSVRIWRQIANIYLRQERHGKAVLAFQRALKVNPDSSTVKAAIQQIHDDMVEQAEEYRKDNQFPKAQECYDVALRANRAPETLKSVAHLHTIMNNMRAAQPLYEEYRELTSKLEKERIEQERTDFVGQGKIHLKKKNYHQAIINFKKAFQIRPDKDVFMFLASIYKSLNHQLALDDLIFHWKNHQKAMKRRRESTV